MKEEKKITIIARDGDNTLEELLKAIKEIGNTGHGFDIEVDREADAEYDEGAPKFYWDGDGSDAIKSIDVEEVLKEINEVITQTKKPSIRGLDSDTIQRMKRFASIKGSKYLGWNGKKHFFNTSEGIKEYSFAQVIRVLVNINEKLLEDITLDIDKGDTNKFINKILKEGYR